MNSHQNSSIAPLRPHVSHGDQRRKGIVLGATGATGRYLVHQLLKSNEWGKVTIVHRREIDINDLNSIGELSDEEKKKLHQYTIDLEHLTDEKNDDIFKGHDVTFCVLGTTRNQAGTAENFRKVDFGMVRDSAIISKRVGIPHYSLLTSKGSNANVWANDWSITHGLLYMKTKGLAEKAVIDLKFPKISIFRPGMLERPGTNRGAEKYAKHFFSSTHVKDLAKVMILDAESDTDINKIESPIFYDEHTIQQLAK